MSSLTNVQDFEMINITDIGSTAAATPVYRPPIYDSPLALNASVSWKMAQVPRITNDAWVNNLRTTLS